MSGSREREIIRNRSRNRDNRSGNRERYCDQSGKKEPMILSCKKVDPIVE